MTPSEQIEVGDTVRWWPDGYHPVMLRRHIDGEVTSMNGTHVTGIRITASSGFTERRYGGFIMPTVGAVVNSSFMPGTIRRISTSNKVGDWVRWEKKGDYAEGWVTKSPYINSLIMTCERTSLLPRPAATDTLREDPDGSLSFRGVKITSPVDPLDVEHDGVTLRRLLEMDANKRSEWIVGTIITPAQRAAVSAHWSAELRAKVAATKERERCVVSYSEWEPGE